MSRERTVTVCPDIRGLPRLFDYTVPPELSGEVRIGTIVRFDLHGRRVRGWVVAEGPSDPDRQDRKPLLKVTGAGPAPEILELARWAAWRWAGPPSAFLSTASPARAIRTLPPPAVRGSHAPELTHEARVVMDAVAAGHTECVLRLAPDSPVVPLVAGLAAEMGPLLVLVPTQDGATRLGSALARLGEPTATMPADWAAAAGGGRTVVGTRAAAWAPCEPVGAVVVLDEHDEAYTQTQTPTWNAREVARQRARNAGVPVVMVSPTPSGEATAGAELLVGDRSIERGGWPTVEVVDLRLEDPARGGLISEPLVTRLRQGGRCICVLNRKGRSRLLACPGCRSVARCETCGAAVAQTEQGSLACRRCGAERPSVCLSCGRSRLSNVRRGITRVREDLELLLGEPVGEMTAGDEDPGERVIIGTEAVLGRRLRAATVAFLDFDQELLAPRYRAGEQALALLARAGRATGGRRRGEGRVLVQTAVASHPVLAAAVAGDPAIFSGPEAQRRSELRWPPAWALAAISGEAAGEFVESLGSCLEVEILGPVNDQWLLRAPDHRSLCDLLGATPRPRGRLRIEVDPLRV